MGNQGRQKLQFIYSSPINDLFNLIKAKILINKGYYLSSSIEPLEPINKKLLYRKRLKMLFVNQHADYMKNLLNYCKGEMAWAQAKQAYFVNYYRTPPPEIYVGDWVWLNIYNISTQRLIKLLNYKNLSPYQIK